MTTFYSEVQDGTDALCSTIITKQK